MSDTDDHSMSDTDDPDDSNSCDSDQDDDFVVHGKERYNIFYRQLNDAVYSLSCRALNFSTLIDRHILEYVLSCQQDTLSDYNIDLLSNGVLPQDRDIIRQIHHYYTAHLVKGN